MKKLLAVASFAAFAACPAAACDWTRAASASDPVAVVAAAAEQTPQAAPAAPEARSVTVDASDRKPIGAQAAIVLITDRH